MDRGLWVTWYNLPEKGREDYLAWLHGEVHPGAAQAPGLSVGRALRVGRRSKVPRRTTGRKITTTDPEVPKGDRFILIFGAEDSNVFGNPLPREIHDELPAKGKEMIAMRIEPRQNIWTEAARLDGPEAKNYREGMTLAPCIQMGSFQARWQDEDEALSWYAKWRMPSLSRLPGCIRVRKLASVAGWAKQSILLRIHVAGSAQPLPAFARGRRRQSRVDGQGHRCARARAGLGERGAAGCGRR